MAVDYQGIYILSSGMLLQQRKMSTITNNLANVNTPAFKKDLMLAGSWITPFNQGRTNSPEDPANNFVYPIVERVYTDLSQGNIVRTGNPTDIAIDGQGFFALTDGQRTLYTRKGNFRLDSEGYLVNELGMRVLLENGQPVRVEGQVEVSPDGTVFSNGIPVGKLQVVGLENPQKEGNDLYTGNPIEAQNYKVLQGHLEMSNVNAIVEMVRLIEAHRAHEVYSNLIRSLDDIQGKANNLGR